MRRGLLSNGRKVTILQKGSWTGLLPPAGLSAEASTSWPLRAGEHGVRQLRAIWPAQGRADTRWALNMSGLLAVAPPSFRGAIVTERNEEVAWKASACPGAWDCAVAETSRWASML